MKKLLLYIFISFLIVNIIDPTNTVFKIKYLLFVLFVIMGTMYIIKINKSLNFKYNMLIVIGFFYLIITYSIIVGTLNDFDNYSLAIPFIYLILIIYIVNINFNIYNTMQYIIFIVAILNIVTLIIVLSFPDYFIILYSFFTEHSNVIMFAKRNLFGIESYMIYHKSSALLLFPLLYFSYTYFNSKKILYFILACTVLFGILLSGTRANIIVSFLGLLLLTFHFLFLRKKYIKLFLIVLGLLVFFINSFDYVILAFDSDEMSNSIKLMHIESILNSINNNSLFSIFFGQGIGSLYYSSALDDFTDLTEVTYFEIFRIFGAIGIILFFFLLIIIPGYFFKNISDLRKKPYIYYSYYLYLLISSSNPLLLSTTGMIVIMMVYVEIFKYKDNIC